MQRNSISGFGPTGMLIVRACLALGLVVLVGGGLTAWGLRDSSYNTGVGAAIAQPLPFSHKHHVGDDGIDCRYCHTSVETSAYAGMPTTHTCMSCHSQIWKDSPVLDPLRKSQATGTPLEWQRVTRLPRFVYFHHAIHVNKGIGCTTCHGRVDQMPLTWKARSFTMKDCLSCHRDPKPHLRAPEDIFKLDWTSDGHGEEWAKHYGIPDVRQNPMLMECNTCHR